jgi:hypothetical protein
MSGVAPYGFKLEPTTVDGIRTKMMAADPAPADHMKLFFDMYSCPTSSYGDIINYVMEHGIDIDGIELSRVQLSYMLKNPVYVKADLDVYEFFKSQGAHIVNDAADFTGTNGCYLYRGRDVEESKYSTFKDHILVIAPHEGLVSSETWLACRKKLMNNPTFGGGRKAKHTWLSGKIKCGKCGAGLMHHNSYFRCRKKLDAKTCEGCGTLRVREIEQLMYDKMQKKLHDFQTITGGNHAKANPKLTAYSVELAQVEAEIEKLLDTLIGANKTLLSYANGKIEELDAKRQSLTKTIADMTAEAVSPEQIQRISGYLNDWDNVSFEDRRLVVDGLVTQIQATSDSFNVDWKV